MRSLIEIEKNTFYGTAHQVIEGVCVYVKHFVSIYQIGRFGECLFPCEQWIIWFVQFIVSLHVHARNDRAADNKSAIMFDGGNH